MFFTNHPTKCDNSAYINPTRTLREPVLCWWNADLSTSVEWREQEINGRAPTCFMQVSISRFRLGGALFALKRLIFFRRFIFLYFFGNTLNIGSDFIKKSVYIFFGFLIGFINSLLGAGGGMIAVPLLKRSSLSQNEAHASAIAVILPLTFISASMYLFKGYVAFDDVFPFVVFGIIGSIFGTLILKKISAKMLKRIFAVFMIYAGIRMILR